MTLPLAESNIIDVPSTIHVTSERDRVSTGYKPLDEALHGGYPAGYAILFSSPSCDERDLLLRRFLGVGAGRGLTIYLTKTFERVADLAAAHRDSFHVVVCNDSERVPEMRNVLQVPRCDDLCSMNIAVSKVLRRARDGQPRKFVVDLISDVLLSRGAVTTRNWLWDLIVRMKARGFTLLGAFNPAMHPSEDSQALLELFDGHISVEEGAGGGRLACVRKMYACAYDDSLVALDRDVLMKPTGCCPR